MNFDVTDDRFGEKTKLNVSFGYYKDNFSRAASFTIAEDSEDSSLGEMYCTATTNIEGASIPDDCILVKNWSENVGIEKILHDAGIIEKDQIGSVPNGFINAAVFRLTDEALEAFPPRPQHAPRPF
jgi:hypothetical protein